jgi:DNA polymerase (family 10)
MTLKEKPTLDKYGIAAALQEIGVLLELKGGQNRFKAKAYKAGARTITSVSEDLQSLIGSGRLTTLPGIGSALASQIEQLYTIGESSVLRNLRAEFPSGIVELSAVPGLSLGKIKQLHEELGINSVEDLKAAIETGTLRTVKGFGPKTEQALLGAIAKGKQPRPPQRLHLHHALRVGEQLVEYLQIGPGVLQVSFAGSLRRWKETIGTVRIVCAAKDPGRVLEHFVRFPLLLSTQVDSENNCSGRFHDGTAVSLTVTPSDHFPLALWLETGSQEHLAKVEQLAQEKRVDLATSKLPRSEEDLYKRLKMQFVAPEMREDNGEIEAALAGELPVDLISLDDIKGMVHCHTTYSDGKHSVEEMAREAERMGMKYITITDHSPTASYAGGLTIDRLKRQWDEIDEVQEQVKVRLLRGTESDIVANGALDYPDDILEKFDVIVASIHARYKMDRQKMTERIITAMRQPVFKIWGHGLGRLIQRRPPFECDVEKILDVIAESNAAVEINGDPYRLDLEPRWVREARKRKIKFVISVDAHSTGALHNLQFGVGMARRGWVRKGEVLNALDLKKFAAAVRPT